MSKLHNEYRKQLDQVTAKYAKEIAAAQIEAENKKREAKAQYDSALSGISPTLSSKNPEAFSSLINSIHNTYGNSLHTAQLEYDKKVKNAQLAYDTVCENINTALLNAQLAQSATYQRYNQNSNAKFQSVAINVVNSVSVKAPRISTIATTR